MSSLRTPSDPAWPANPRSVGEPPAPPTSNPKGPILGAGGSPTQATGGCVAAPQALPAPPPSRSLKGPLPLSAAFCASFLSRRDTAAGATRANAPGAGVRRSCPPAPSPPRTTPCSLAGQGSQESASVPIQLATGASFLMSTSHSGTQNLASSEQILERPRRTPWGAPR